LKMRLKIDADCWHRRRRRRRRRQYDKHVCEIN
jgi:hypothetical protein